MDDAELAPTRLTPPPAVGTPAARRTPSTPTFAAPGASVPAAPSVTRVPASAPPTPSPSRLELVLSTGERIRVAGRGVIGRDPSEAAGSYVHRLALPDTEKTLSRAHLEFGVEANGQFWVSDLHSTNGVAVERAGQATQRCLPGYRVAIQPGDRVRFGGRELTIQAV